ncbi:MAG: hypothetical protein UU20_C0013G0001, partial [Parcubacteria group bacterium GW2011_GWE2_40_8]
KVWITFTPMSRLNLDIGVKNKMASGFMI